MASIEIRILKSMPFGRKKGDVVKLESDADGVPLSRYWRDRLKEAEIDGCCEVKKSKSSDKTAGAK